jgi:hypothetical protein
MNKKALLILSVISLTNLFCSGFQLNESNAKMELQSAANDIAKDKGSIYKLDRKVIGKKGYFYMIRNDGRVLYHPKKALINYDFSRYSFVQQMLKKRNGCFSYNAEGTERYIFFREINDNEILCLTLDGSEFGEEIKGCESDIEDKK